MARSSPVSTVTLAITTIIVLGVAATLAAAQPKPPAIPSARPIRYFIPGRLAAYCWQAPRRAIPNFPRLIFFQGDFQSFPRII